MPYSEYALNTANLKPDASSIVTPSDHFNAVSYNGAYDGYSSYSGTSPQSITNVGFQPDIVWIKDRDGQASNATGYYGNYLFDSMRGAGRAFNVDGDVYTGSDSLMSYEDGISSFTATGFDVDEAEETNYMADTDWDYTPDTPERYMAYCWKLGSTGSSSTWASGNTDPAEERYNATAGASLLNYSESSYSSGSLTLNHSLNAAPEFVFILDAWGGASGAYAWHKDLASGKYLEMTTNGAEISDTTVFPANPSTNTTFSVGSSVHTGYEDLYFYAFTGIEGYSSFGKFSGGGKAYTGFLPKLILYKRIDSTGPWIMIDTVRDPFNTATKSLQANSSTNESTSSTYELDVFSDGFEHQTSGGTYIYASWGDIPSWAANAR